MPENFKRKRVLRLLACTCSQAPLVRCRGDQTFDFNRLQTSLLHSDGVVSFQNVDERIHRLVQYEATAPRPGRRRPITVCIAIPGNQTLRAAGCEGDGYLIDMLLEYMRWIPGMLSARQLY